MPQINYARREISCKVVFYGPGLSGKTTNLEIIHEKDPNQDKGNLTSIATEGDRTLYFDYKPLDLGQIAGMATKFQLYTVPGQAYYNATRKLVLTGADGLVFVADSQKEKMKENLESLKNLEDNLKEHEIELSKIPFVLQYNKRDLPNIHTVQEMNDALNKYHVPAVEAVAFKGTGVFETLKAIATLVLEKLSGNANINTSQNRGSRIAPKMPSAPVGSPIQNYPQNNNSSSNYGTNASPYQTPQPYQGQGQGQPPSYTPQSPYGYPPQQPPGYPQQPAYSPGNVTNPQGAYWGGNASPQQYNPQQGRPQTPPPHYGNPANPGMQPSYPQANQNVGRPGTPYSQNQGSTLQQHPPGTYNPQQTQGSFHSTPGTPPGAYPKPQNQPGTYSSPPPYGNSQGNPQQSPYRPPLPGGQTPPTTGSGYASGSFQKPPAYAPPPTGTGVPSKYPARPNPPAPPMNPNQKK